jgi:hypothetical protein
MSSENFAKLYKNAGKPDVRKAGKIFYFSDNSRISAVVGPKLPWSCENNGAMMK